MRKLVQGRVSVSRSVIVDSNGAISFEPMATAKDSDRLSKGTPLERIDLSGCIEWRESRGNVQIQFRPSLTTATARDTIFRWLQCDLKRRVHLRYWRNGGWQDEIIGQSMAVRRIEQIIFQEGGGNDAPMIRRLKNYSNEVNTHREVLAFWSERRDTFSLDADFPVLHDITSGRTILLRFDANFGYIASGAGLGMPPGLRRWMNKSDQLLSDFPDSHYVNQLTAAYDEAIQSSRPIADEVDGLIKFPNVSRQRYSYHRIIIPISIGDAKYILSSTMKDDSIDLFS